MVALRNANVITTYDDRRLGLPNIPLDMEYDNSSIEYDRRRRSGLPSASIDMQK
tara:strand:- start:139 stop:300 length:162 start_codon:yes stop_codon:yes gene_type:complete